MGYFYKLCGLVLVFLYFCSVCPPSAWCSGDIEKLCYMLESKEDRDRVYAVDELVRIGSRAVPSLIEVLGRGQVYLARQGAAEALGRIGDTRAVKPLVQALNDPMYFVKEKSLIALGQLGDPSAVPGIIEVLKKENVYLKRVGADTLGNFRDKRAISYLKELARDSDSEVAARAMKSLERLGK